MNIQNGSGTRTLLCSTSLLCVVEITIVVMSVFFCCFLAVNDSPVGKRGFIGMAEYSTLITVSIVYSCWFSSLVNWSSIVGIIDVCAISVFFNVIDMTVRDCCVLGLGALPSVVLVGECRVQGLGT